jgi:hypothetical protein
MRKTSPAPGPGIDSAELPIDRALDDLLAAAYRWLDDLEPFCIDWELIWPM